MLSVFVKLLERILRAEIYFHMKVRSFLTRATWILHKLSCNTNLIVSREDLCSARECRVPLHDIMTDFVKAFDKVNHDHLESLLPRHRG